MRLRVLLLGLCASLALAGETPPPELMWNSEQQLLLTRLPDLLADPEVAPHLTSGLTTSVAFRVQVHGKPVGGARIELRYELWDAVFHVAALGIDGKRAGKTLASQDELSAWWRTVQLLVVADPTVLAPAGQVRLVADVLPFSQAEQDDTQRWFSESLSQASRSGSEQVADAADERLEPVSEVLNLLLATSIKRRTLASYTWSLTVPPTRAAGAP